jgi:hypothetical protein
VVKLVILIKYFNPVELKYFVDVEKTITENLNNQGTHMIQASVV